MKSNLLLKAAGLFALVLNMQAGAQTTAIETIQGVDLAVTSLPMKAHWSGGILRVKLRGLPTTAIPTIRVTYGDAGELILDEVQLAARTLRRTESDVVIELPIVAGRSVKLVEPPLGLKASALEVIAPNLVKSEQRLDGSFVASIDDKASVLAKANALAFGRLSAYTATMQPPFDCTAFRVAKGYWMTAAHCGYRSPEDPTRPAFTMWKLQTQDWAGQLESAPPLEARPIASGLKATLPTPDAMMGSDDLDWMLLHVDSDPGGPALTLRVGSNPADEAPLELLQHSLGRIPPPAGKAYSSGPMCKVLGEGAGSGTANPDYCIQSMRHGCSSQPGASGGPLVSKADLSLIAVHYRSGLSGLWNCGIPAATVARDVCTRFPTLASKVLKCATN